MMAGEERKAALNAAKQLEEMRDPAGAVRAYLKAKAPLDAARILAAHGRPTMAGDVIMRALHASLEDLASLAGPRRDAAILAAGYYDAGGDGAKAVRVLLALHERDRAANVLEAQGDGEAAERLRKGPGAGASSSSSDKRRAERKRAQLEAETHVQNGRLLEAREAFMASEDWYEAGRVCWQLGAKKEAGELLMRTDRYFEAGTCFVEAGDSQAALDALVRVTESHPRYRMACVKAIQLAYELGVASFPLEHMLTDFVTSGPKDKRELNAFYGLGQHYERHGLFESALEAYRQVVERKPEFNDCQKRIEEIEATLRGSATQYAQLLAASTRVDAEELDWDQLPELPGLPDLPDFEDEPDDETDPVTPPTPFQEVSGDAGPPAQRKRDGRVYTITDRAGKKTAMVPAAEGTVTGSGTAKQAASVGMLIGPGSLVAERYRIEEKLGDGATASVYRALDLELTDQIAMKIFHLRLADNEVLSQRMKLELRLCRQLAHPNIIRIYDMGTFHQHRYLTMELLRGKTLNQLMREPMSMRRALSYLSQACRGLHAAHIKGIVHRDVKPDNLFVTTEGVVKVMDFGIAKQRASEGVTLTGTILGTPGYMAPEQIDGSSEVTASADQYAIGAVAYRLLTGTKVFDHEDVVPLLMMHATQDPEPPSERNPRIPSALEEVVLQLLNKGPRGRFESCDVVAEVVEDIAAAL